MAYLVGIDDSDSPLGLCTTFLGYRLVLKLLERGCGMRSYPRLVRLNPNIPFKTRGNAAVCIEFESTEPDAAFETICNLVEKYSDLKNGANTGVVLVRARPPHYLANLYQRALSELVNKSGVLTALSSLDARVFTLGNGMGVVGASAALGFDTLRDHTYELLAYRRREMYGAPRGVDRESVISMDRRTFPHTYNNYDYENGRTMITPHGPDPVLLGIRGDSPGAVFAAFSTIRCSEHAEGHMIYISNQHTDAHLRHQMTFPLKAFSSGWLEGRVILVEAGPGAHVYIRLGVGAETAICAVYEPTGDLRRAARLLMPGDVVRVAGGVRRPSLKHPRLLNVERMEVTSLQKAFRHSNPICGGCGTRMNSEGRAKGFQCTKCKARLSGGRVSHEIERDLQKGIYVSSPRSQRHLTKQLIRYGSELDDESSPLIEGWIGSESLRPLRVPARSP